MPTPTDQSATATITVPVHVSWFQKEALAFLGILRDFWTAYEPFFKTESQQLLAQLAPIAIAAVSAQLSGTGSGNDKLQAATAQVKADLINAGIQASTTAIQTAIQLAKLQLDAKIASTPVLNSTPVPTPANS